MTTKGARDTKEPDKAFTPVHPGEILYEEFMEPMGVTKYRLAKDTGVPPGRIGKIVEGKRAITADTALRLSRFFGTSERFWLNLQVRYDIEIEKDHKGQEIEKIERFASV